MSVHSNIVYIAKNSEWLKDLSQRWQQVNIVIYSTVQLCAKVSMAWSVIFIMDEFQTHKVKNKSQNNIYNMIAFLWNAKKGMGLRKKVETLMFGICANAPEYKPII
jgi:hypothetical protein